MKEIMEWAKEIIIAIVIAAILLCFFKPIVVRQSSMVPTFYDGDYVFVSKQAYTLFGDVERGDVVVFHSKLKDDENHDKNLIKRVVGLPGDRIAIVEGYLYLNGEKLDEPYVAEQGISGEMEEITIPEGEIFAVGDNRGVSQDSRDPAIGCISEEELLGKVVLRVYPFNKIGTF